jgi:hypothetical protein
MKITSFKECFKKCHLMFLFFKMIIYKLAYKFLIWILDGQVASYNHGYQDLCFVDFLESVQIIFLNVF